MTQTPYPAGGALIDWHNGEWQVPDNPWIGCIAGDGIGPEIMQASRRVWDAAIKTAYGERRRIVWCDLPLGEAAAGQGGDAFPQTTLAALRQLRVAIKGPLTTPVGGGFRSLNVALRQTLDLYACVRPVRHYAGVPSPMLRPEDLDVVIFRENTEDVYAGIEYAAGSAENAKLANFLRRELGAQFFDGAALGIKPVSEHASKRLIKMAIEYAIAHGRRSVTLVHKGNIMKYTEGAFREWGYEVAREHFPGLTVREDELDGAEAPAGKIIIKDRIADAMFQMLLLRPAEYDVIATMNLNGDYLSDALAAQVGGIGIAPGANIGAGLAVFEATHGSAPKHAGKNRANPSSLLLSGVMLLEHLGWHEAAERINRAYAATIAEKTVTYDFARLMEGAREVSTRAFADALIGNLT
ncbi:isocitrate dehydrogenase (NADP(+)) [Cardiobacterium hominis]|uniref:isocitrate dehydrogenase (NADP(+)) n=1 Tax=Cardiobacterium hominis TaxID=2718 RepID=UPI0028F0CFF0|nr:isocitrate dehydrogenase (NADP(+)) [Cardiobacterium hominis]